MRVVTIKDFISLLEAQEEALLDSQTEGNISSDIIITEFNHIYLHNYKKAFIEKILKIDYSSANTGFVMRSELSPSHYLQEIANGNIQIDSLNIDQLIELKRLLSGSNFNLECFGSVDSGLISEGFYNICYFVDNFSDKEITLGSRIDLNFTEFIINNKNVSTFFYDRTSLIAENIDCANYSLYIDGCFFDTLLDLYPDAWNRLSYNINLLNSIKNNTYPVNSMNISNLGKQLLNKINVNYEIAIERAYINIEKIFSYKNTLPESINDIINFDISSFNGSLESLIGIAAEHHNYYMPYINSINRSLSHVIINPESIKIIEGLPPESIEHILSFLS